MVFLLGRVVRVRLSKVARSLTCFPTGARADRKVEVVVAVSRLRRGYTTGDLVRARASHWQRGVLE